MDNYIYAIRNYKQLFEFPLSHYTVEYRDSLNSNISIEYVLYGAWIISERGNPLGLKNFSP